MIKAPFIVTRRKSLQLISAAACTAPWATGQAQDTSQPPSAERVRLRATPAQTEGPYYPVALPSDADSDLLNNDGKVYAPQQRVALSGVVRDLDGKPLKGAVVEIWQCDEQGHYHHPGDGGRADPAFQGFGRTRVDDEGRYSFKTMRPADYAGRTPHIHVKVKLGPTELLTTQLYVKDDPGNARDGLWRSLRNAEDRAAITVPFVPSGNGWLAANFPIVVRA